MIQRVYSEKEGKEKEKMKDNVKLFGIIYLLMNI